MRNPYKPILLSVCSSIKSIYLEVMWRYQAEINVKCLGLGSLVAEKSSFYVNVNAFVWELPRKQKPKLYI